MNKQDIQLLYQYDEWASRRILDAAAKVTAEQFVAPAAFPYGGLRGTLTHALSAEWVWRKRWEGESPTKHLQPEEFATFDSLQERWLEETKKLNAFVESLTDEKLNTVFQYKSLGGDPFDNILWHMMAHVANHSTQHRSEAAAILTDLGYSPGDLDMILFLRETK